jgi:hypothetical protein
MHQVLTVEWLMHFMNGYMHGSSMVLAVNLVCILYQASLEFQSSFRSQNGYACVCHAPYVVRTDDEPLVWTNRFRVMQQVVVHYCTCVDIYYAAFALLVGCPISRLKKSPKFEQQALVDIVQVHKH